MRTPFSYRYDGYELHANDNSPLGPIFETAIDHAEGFELRRRKLELGEYHDMLSMMRGDLPNTMVVVSDFPQELVDAPNDANGYNVARQQTMLRVIVRQSGRLHMYSQTLDGSNRQALEVIYGVLGFKPDGGELLGQRMHVHMDEPWQNKLTDQLTNTYDASLEQQFGGNWHAGRQESLLDTYSFVLSQKNVVERYVRQQVGGCATNSDRFNMAAWMTKKYDAFKRPLAQYDVESAAFVMQVFNRPFEHDLQRAGDEARQAGKTFSGCGISDSGAQSQYDNLGYGGDNSEHGPDGKGPLTFKCKNGHTNTRPPGKLITQCRIASCKDSVGC